MWKLIFSRTVWLLSISWKSAVTWRLHVGCRERSYYWLSMRMVDISPPQPSISTRTSSSKTTLTAVVWEVRSGSRSLQGWVTSCWLSTVLLTSSSTGQLGDSSSQLWPFSWEDFQAEPIRIPRIFKFKILDVHGKYLIQCIMFAIINSW